MKWNVWTFILVGLHSSPAKGYNTLKYRPGNNNTREGMTFSLSNGTARTATTGCNFLLLAWIAQNLRKGYGNSGFSIQSAKMTNGCSTACNVKSPTPFCIYVPNATRSVKLINWSFGVLFEKNWHFRSFFSSAHVEPALGNLVME